MTIGFQAWSADGKPLFRPADYTFRVLSEVDIPAMTGGTRTIYNAHCVPGKARIYIIPIGSLFSRQWLYLGTVLPNFKPRVFMGAGYFQLHLPAGGTAPTMRAIIFSMGVA